MGVLLKQGVKASITGCTTEQEYKHMNCNIMIEGGKNILLCVVYRAPPSRSNGLRTSNFFSEWSAYLESLVLIRKYGLNMCRQCFRQYADEIGFKKLD